MLVFGGERTVILLVKDDPVSDPERCRKRVLKAIKRLPKPAPAGALDSKAAVQRAWLVARCASCGACVPR